MRDTIQRIFRRHPDNMEHVQEEVLGTLDSFQDPFATMATAYMQDKTIKELSSPVEPEEIVMSQKACRKKKGKTRVLTIKNNVFYYMPLIKSLEQLLSNSRIFNMINTTPQRCLKDGFLYDINDGSLFKTHPLFSTRPCALQVIRMK